MRALLAFSRAIDRLSEFIGRHIIWLIFASTLISGINAAIRKAFNYSSNAFLEVQWYFFAASFLLVAGYTLFQGEHVDVSDILADVRTTKSAEEELAEEIARLAEEKEKAAKAAAETK